MQTLSRCPSVPVQRYTSCHKHCCLHINPKHDFGTDEAGVLNFSNSFPLNQQKAVGLLYSVVAASQSVQSVILGFVAITYPSKLGPR